jgi:hypothetical protein
VAAHTVDGLHVTASVTAEPRYIPHDSAMYHNIVRHQGQLYSFGMDFSQKLLSHHSTWYVAIPYLLLVAGAVGLQYLQMSRLNARNPGASQANPQAAMLQKYMPLIFGFIYLNVAAILNVYFIISSGIRILTQEILFRKGMVGGPPPPPTAGVKESGPKPATVDRSERPLPKPKAGAVGSGSKSGTRPNGSNGTNGSNGKARRPAADAPIEAQASEKRRPPNRSAGGNGSTNGTATSTGAARKRPAPSNGNRSGGTRPGGAAKGSSNGSSNGSNGSKQTNSDDESSARPKEHPRSKAKRERKAR